MEHTAEYYKYIKYKTKYLDLKQELDAMHGGEPKQTYAEYEEMSFSSKELDINPIYVNAINKAVYQYNRHFLELKQRVNDCGKNITAEAGTDSVKESLLTYVRAVNHIATNFNNIKLEVEHKNESYLTEATVGEITFMYDNYVDALRQITSAYLAFLENIATTNSLLDTEREMYNCYHTLFVRDYKELINDMIDIHNTFNEIDNQTLISNFNVTRSEIGKLFALINTINNMLQAKSLAVLDIRGFHDIVDDKSDKSRKRSFCLIL